VSDEGDVEPDDVAPVAATHPVLYVIPSSAPVRSRDEAATEPVNVGRAGWVRAAPSPERTPLSGGGPGFPGPAGSLLAGVTLRCPGSQAGPTTVDTPDRGQKMCFPPESIVESKSTAVLSDSGVPGPVGVGTPAASASAAAAGETPSFAAQRPLQLQATVQNPATQFWKSLQPPHATAAAADLTL